MIVLVHDSEIKVKGSPFGLWTVVLSICRKWHSYLTALLPQVCRN